MKISKQNWTNLTGAAVLALTSTAALAQADARTGTSHPDEAVISNAVSDETPQPAPAAVVAAPPAAAPAAQTRTVLRAATETSETERIPSAAALREARPHVDIDAGIVTRVPGKSNELPEGTLIKTRMDEVLSTKDTRLGAPFTAQLTEPVLRDGRVLLPAGTIVSGKVTEVHGGRRISGAASIHLLPQTVTLPDGSKYPIHGLVIDTDLYHSTKVDREGTIIRRDHPRETLAVLAMTTGSGAAAGSVIGGGAGLLIGAGVGAGVGTAVWLKQDRQTTLPPDTHITFALTSSLFVGTEQ